MTTPPAPGTWYVSLDGQQLSAQMAPAPEGERVLGWGKHGMANGVSLHATVRADDAGRVSIDNLFLQAPDGGSISAQDLRSIRLSDLMAHVADELVTLQNKPWQRLLGITEGAAEIIDAAHAGPAARSERGRIPERTLRRVAELYLAEQHRGPGLRRRMLRAMRMPASAEPTLRYWIVRARGDGWLSPAEHGSRSAAPGPRLLDHIEKKEQQR